MCSGWYCLRINMGCGWYIPFDFRKQSSKRSFHFISSCQRKTLTPMPTFRDINTSSILKTSFSSTAIPCPTVHLLGRDFRQQWNQMDSGMRCWRQTAINVLFLVSLFTTWGRSRILTACQRRCTFLLVLIVCWRRQKGDPYRLHIRY